MPERRGVSAAEKYAEIKETGAEWPRCSCHGAEKLWAKDVRYRPGGYWRCTVKGHEHGRHWRESNPEKNRANVRRYYQTNPEKQRARSRRYYEANQERERARRRDYWRLNR